MLSPTPVSHMVDPTQSPIAPSAISRTDSKIPSSKSVSILKNKLCILFPLETELMIVVTPYLVNPVAANKIVLPTDGYRAPSELGRIFGGEVYKSGPSAKRPVPTMAPPTTVRGGGVPAPGFSN